MGAGLLAAQKQSPSIEPPSHSNKINKGERERGDGGEGPKTKRTE